MSDSMSNDKRRSLTIYNHITYFLYVISYFTAGLLWIVPIVMMDVRLVHVLHPARLAVRQLLTRP